MDPINEELYYLCPHLTVKGVKVADAEWLQFVSSLMKVQIKLKGDVLYYMSKKKWPHSYINLLYKMDHYFLDIQYVGSNLT